MRNFFERIEPFHSRLSHQIQTIFSKKQSRLDALRENLISNNPQNRVLSGFAQISKEGKVVSLEALHIEESFELMNEKMKVTSKVLSIKVY